MKRCSRCGVVQELTAFARDRSTKDGLCRWCKGCQKAYREANRDRLRAKDAEYRASNLEKRRAQQRAYYERNRETFNQKVAAYRKKNASAVKATKQAHYRANSAKYKARSAAYKKTNAGRVRELERAWRKRNAERLAAAAKKWLEANRERSRAIKKAYAERHPEVIRAKQARRRARKAAVRVERITAKQIDARMSVFGYQCAYCGGPFDEIEHVKALARGGPHILANLRPSCAPCNNQKGTMDHRTWLATLRGRREHRS